MYKNKTRYYFLPPPAPLEPLVLLNVTDLGSYAFIVLFDTGVAFLPPLLLAQHESHRIKANANDLAIYFFSFSLYVDDDSKLNNTTKKKRV